MDWQPEYSVGIEEIDNQHRVFFDYLNLIEDSIHLHESWTNLYATLEQLEEHSKVHFSVEEALMHMYGYPDAAAHILSHKQLIASIEDLKFQSTSSNVSDKAIKFMRHWFEEHIKVADCQYARFILKGAHIIRSKQAEGEPDGESGQ